MDWFYKATNASLDLAGTLALAERHGFVCRSARNVKGHWSSNVRKVNVGDTLHVYYSADGKPRALGAFEVIAREQHPTPDFFGPVVRGSALLSVEKSAFIAEVDPDGIYQPDRWIGRFTGWLVRRTGDAREANATFLGGRATLLAVTKTSGTSPNVETDARPGRARENDEAWSEATFFAKVREVAADKELGLRALFELVRSRSGIQIVWGRGNELARFIARVPNNTSDLVSGWHDGWVGLQATEIRRIVGRNAAALTRLAALVNRPHWVSDDESSSATPIDDKRKRFDAGELERDEVAEAIDEMLLALERGEEPAPGSEPRSPTGTRSSIGQPYVPVGKVPGSRRSDPFERDPDKIDRGNQAHADTQDELARFIQAQGMSPLRPDGTGPDFDLAWERGDTLFVAEVKSTTEENQEKQLRLGLGQVLRYRHLLQNIRPKVVGVLVAENAPHDETWLEACNQVGVTLVWRGSFDSLLASA